MFKYSSSVLKVLQQLIILCIFVGQSSTFRIRNAEDAVAYLYRFGYFDESKSIDELSRNEITQAVKEFQEISHIPQDGQINSQTLNKMNSARCGNRDDLLLEDEVNEVNPRQNQRTKRSVAGQKWDKGLLTYKILEFPSNKRLNPRAVQREFDQAFKYWEKVTNIKFKKITTGKADIRIKFVRGDHGDKENFDGPGKSLAHAFHPKLSAVHLDDQEMWSTSSKIKKRHYDIRTVAVHEIGHALDLHHSNSSKAVMYFQYRGHRGLHENFQLDVDDIQAIQSLYGEKKKKLKAKGKKSKGKQLNGKPNLCIDPTFDAITTLNDGFIYIFKNEFFFRLDSVDGKVSNGYPRLINETFKGLPSNLDTVLTMKNITYFFKGSLYWQSNGTLMEAGYPKKIKERFHNIPINLNAACAWSVNGAIYFFKGKTYWRFSEDPKSAQNYSRTIFEHWPGLPNNIGTCFLAPNNRTYFFKNKKYWRYHLESSELEATDYPRLTSDGWFQCPSR